MTCVHLATGAASGGKSSEHGQPFRRRIAINGSAVSGIGETGDIGRNCARGLRPLVSIWLPSGSHKNAPCCGSMDNMGMGQCSLMWLGSRL
jgi:hypothetical protein